jgi:hypothetical protein
MECHGEKVLSIWSLKHFGLWNTMQNRILFEKNNDLQTVGDMLAVMFS